MSENRDQHNREIQKNREAWENKPLLREVYLSLQKSMAEWIQPDLTGLKIEIGSGIGNLKRQVPDCLLTDLFPNPWIEQVENVYTLSFSDTSVSHIFGMDVLHHFEYPGSAFEEIHRVLIPGGRLILLEPMMSLLGSLVWGVFHHEPVSWFKPIKWKYAQDQDPHKLGYYAAQGNPHRIFLGKETTPLLKQWNIVHLQKYCALAYLASGGYSRGALYPEKWLPFMNSLSKFLDVAPWLFATRLLVVLEKK